LQALTITRVISERELEFLSEENAYSENDQETLYINVKAFVSDLEDHGELLRKKKVWQQIPMRMIATH